MRQADLTKCAFSSRFQYRPKPGANRMGVDASDRPPRTRLREISTAFGIHMNQSASPFDFTSKWNSFFPGTTTAEKGVFEVCEYDSGRSCTESRASIISPML